MQSPKVEVSQKVLAQRFDYVPHILASKPSEIGWSR